NVSTTNGTYVVLWRIVCVAGATDSRRSPALRVAGSGQRGPGELVDPGADVEDRFLDAGAAWEGGQPCGRATGRVADLGGVAAGDEHAGGGVRRDLDLEGEPVGLQ